MDYDVLIGMGRHNVHLGDLTCDEHIRVSLLAIREIRQDWHTTGLLLFRAL